MHSARLQELLFHHNQLSDLQDALDQYKSREETYREELEREIVEDAAAYEALEKKAIVVWTILTPL